MASLIERQNFVLRMILNTALCISILSAILIFLVLPTDCASCVQAHTAFYIQIVFFVWLQFTGVCLAALPTVSFAIFYGVFCCITFGNVACLIGNAVSFVPEQTAPFVPSVIGGIFDWTWFALLTISPCFLPYMKNMLRYSVVVTENTQQCPSCLLTVIPA